MEKMAVHTPRTQALQGTKPPDTVTRTPRLQDGEKARLCG